MTATPAFTALNRIPTPEKEARGLFPDKVAHPIISAVRLNSSEMAQSEAPGTQCVSLERAKTLIANALHATSEELGARAAELLNNPARLNLLEVAPGACQMMRCRASLLSAEDVEKSHDALKAIGIEPPAPEALREEFRQFDNPEDYAVIDYEYDGTLDGLVYLAHELGHALADDLQREAGFTHRDNPGHIEEVQAYIIQHAVYQHLTCNPSINSDLADAAEAHYTHTLREQVHTFARHASGSPDLHYRPISFILAGTLFNVASQSRATADQELLLGTLGSRGPKSADALTVEAGLGDPQHLFDAVSAFIYSTPTQNHEFTTLSV